MEIDYSFKIKRENIRITEWDKIYCELLKQIISEGEVFENRTGIDTLSIEGTYFKLNVSKNLPLLESKKVLVKNALSELLWIYQAQSNEVSWLKERSNSIWDEWMIDDDGIYRTYLPNDSNPDSSKAVDLVDLDGNPILNSSGDPIKAYSKYHDKTIVSAKYFGREYAGTIGTAYGWINNKFKRPQYVLEQLKKNPHDRRMNISLWQDEYIKTAVLPSCVWSSEWKVTDNKLNVFVHQRSADVPLGLPFNVIQYSILLSMFAKVSNLEVGNLNWSIMDSHIYINQMDGINTQLKRYDLMKKTEKFIFEHSDFEVMQEYNSLKELENKILTSGSNSKKLEKDLKDVRELSTIFELMLTKEKTVLELADKDNFFEFDNKVNNSKEYLQTNATGNEDIKILKYSSCPFIKMPVAQ